MSSSLCVSCTLADWKCVFYCNFFIILHHAVIYFLFFDNVGNLSKKDVYCLLSSHWVVDFVPQVELDNAEAWIRIRQFSVDNFAF